MPGKKLRALNLQPFCMLPRFVYLVGPCKMLDSLNREGSEELLSQINWSATQTMFLQLRPVQPNKDGPFHDRLISPIHKTVVFVKS